MNFAPVIIATLLVLTGCSASTGGSELPPYALADSIDGARIFGEGSVSTEAPEFATSITPDGKTVYFNRTDDDRSALRIYESTYGDDGWSEAVALPFSDGTYRDVDPFVSIDGDRLYFSSSRPRDGDVPKDFDTWYVERSDSGWSRPINPGSPLNTADDEIFVTQARSGNLYYSVSGQDGRRRIRRSVLRDGEFQDPEDVRFDVPDSVQLGNPAIAPDESFIVVTSGNLDGSGVDLFIAHRRPDGSFGRPENLGAGINSEWTDFAAHVSRDQTYLFFSSERPGIVGEPYEGRRPGDIYIARLPHD